MGAFSFYYVQTYIFFPPLMFSPALSLSLITNVLAFVGHGGMRAHVHSKRAGSDTSVASVDVTMDVKVQREVYM